jgi:iron(III) transport system ATP-binding protein
MVFQSYALWPHLRVGQNVAYGLRMRNVPKDERDAAVRRALERVGLFEKVDSYPHELSGGQQQRIALARAIAYSPEILLFDEPLSNLDAQLRERMREELKAIHRAVGVTAIYVTHDQNEAMALSDRIIVMSRGRIEQIGTPRELYEEPANVDVARFVGKSNIVGAVVLDCGPGWADVRVDGSVRTLRSRSNGSTRRDQRGSLSIRPEGVRLRRLDAGAAAGVRGQVVTAMYLGNMHHYRVRVGADTAFEAECGFGEAFDAGDDVEIDIDPERCYFIAGDHADDVRG